MIPQQHLAWFSDNIAWFEDLPVGDFDLTVPSCPDWVIEDVINHLSLGVGLRYPVALSMAPESPDSDVFVGVEWPDENPTGHAAASAFSRNMRHCLEAFEGFMPSTPCWTYAGPGEAKFWFRRAAIETALHRIDVEDAVPIRKAPLPKDRMIEAIAETLDFVLPLAADLAGTPGGRLIVSSPELGITLDLGEGRRHATIIGEGKDLLCALWGRHKNQVHVVGDHQVASDWLSRIEL